MSSSNTIWILGGLVIAGVVVYAATKNRRRKRLPPPASGTSKRRTKFGTRGLTYKEAERRQNEVPPDIRAQFMDMAGGDRRRYLRMVQGYLEG
jgi:hypothetical protein